MTRTAERGDNRLTFLVIGLLIVVLAIAALAVFQFGLAALGILGLALTVAVFAVMLLFTAGN